MHIEQQPWADVSPEWLAAAERSPLVRNALADAQQQWGRLCFAETPTEAVQCRLATVSGIYWQRKTGSFLGSELDDGNLTDFEETVMQSPLFHWTDDMARMVLEASTTFPLDEQMYNPSLPSAFCTFSRPVLRDEDGRWLSALAWRTFDGGTRGQWMHLYGLQWQGAMTLPIGKWTGPDWTLDDDTRATYSDDSRRCRDSLLRFVLSASTFVEQTICITRDEQPPRHTRKQAARAGLDSLVKVILLRPRRYEHADGDAVGVDYSCRWIVRGHWRQQFYPKAARRIPLWINPFVKGPTDKPLRIPPTTVYEVSR